MLLWDEQSSKSSFDEPSGETLVSALYARFCRPKLGQLLQLLKLDIAYHRAHGSRIYYRRGGHEVSVIDLLGGYGSTILGHNPPLLKKLAHDLLDREIVIHAQASVRSASARLGEAIGEMIRRSSPGQSGQRYIATFLNSGTEAVEAAIKHALIEWNTRRKDLLLQLEVLPERSIAVGMAIQALRDAEPSLVAIESGFHGKTAGSLSMTWNEDYSGMYDSSALECHFLPRDASPEDLNKLFQAHRIFISDDQWLSSIIGVCVEPIQGEGGIHCMDPVLIRSLFDRCQSERIPFIADEIQSGCYRTGQFLASHAYGIDPDYILIGKSLGGGYAKISGFLVAESHYQEEFGVLHTSTFGEDDYSSELALEALRLLSTDSGIPDRAARFEARVRTAIEELMKECPGIIKEIRGRGFMLGIDFDFEMGGVAPRFLDALNQTGYSGYVLASYLLHRHQIRVAATLGDGNTVRLEPSAYITDEEIDYALAAIGAATRLIHQGRFAELTRHLWEDGESQCAPESVLSPLRPKAISVRGLPRVVFLSHLIDADHLAHLDPVFGCMSERARNHFLDEMGPLGQSVIYHEQEIAGSNGSEILLQLRGITVGSDYFEKSLRSGDFRGYEKVLLAAKRAKSDGASYIGLGQFTSIVTENGRMLEGLRGPRITTGNSLTVGLGFQALTRILAERGRSLSDCHVGIVGAAGNICNVYAQLVGDQAGFMTLVHREAYEKSQKFRQAVDSILGHTAIDSKRVRVTSELSDLKDCDVVIAGTNSTRQPIRAEHLKPGALVLDISVPSNIHASVLQQPAGIECFQGGYARLPLGQKLFSDMVPAADGEIFACMAETVTMGLLGMTEHFSIGALSKAKVHEALKCADQVGITLGRLKRMKVI